MKTLLLVISGLPFSGKSTLAKTLSESFSLPIVNYDNDIYAKHKHEVPQGTSPAKEFDMIEAIAREYLAQKLASGQSLVYDDLGLQREDRERVHQVAKDYGAQYLLVFLDTPAEIIEERRKANHESQGRDHIGDEKLQLDMSLLEKPQADENHIIVKPEDTDERVLSDIRKRLS